MSGAVSDESNDRIPRLLFAYGTLGPADEVVRARDGWEPDAVRGRLYDLGPYPALVGLDEEGAGWVEGHVRGVEEGELRDVLDPYEGVEEGLFHRTRTSTRAGRKAWVYTYGREIPANARGPLERWDGERRRLDRPPVTIPIDGRAGRPGGRSIE